MNVQPPIYIINLANDSARLASVTQQLAAQGLVFERVEAVDGRALTTEQRQGTYSKFWYILFNGRSPTAAELGCNLSHRKIWKMMIERGQEWAIIFEDDLLLSPDFSRHLHRFEKTTMSYDVVQFYSLRQPNIVKFELPDTQYRLMSYSGANPTATAYGLRASGAKKLLKYDRIIFPNDKWVMARALLGVKCGAIFPFPVTLHDTHSKLSTIVETENTKRHGHILWRIFILPVLRLVRSICLKIRDV